MHEKGEAYENSTSRERCAVASSGVEAIAMRLDPAGCDGSRRSSVGCDCIWQADLIPAAEVTQARRIISPCSGPARAHQP